MNRTIANIPMKGHKLLYDNVQGLNTLTHSFTVLTQESQGTLKTLAYDQF